jgi:hypothetical protein
MAQSFFDAGSKMPAGVLLDIAKTVREFTKAATKGTPFSWTESATTFQCPPLHMVPSPAKAAIESLQAYVHWFAASDLRYQGVLHDCADAEIDELEADSDELQAIADEFRHC